MAELNDLLESYYDEIDPARRLAILNEYLAAAGDSDPAAAYRKQLYEYRHVDPANPGRTMDKFMLAFLDYLYLFRNSAFLPARNVKETTKILKGLEQDERVHTDPLFEEAFSLEVRNAALRYFDTTKTERYHRKFFGFVASKGDEREKQRCIDMWRLSYGLAERLGLEKEMGVFCQAVSDEYKLSRPDGMSLQEAYSYYTKK